MTTRAHQRRHRRHRREVLARVDLRRTLAGVDHHLVTVSVTVEDVGVDLYLDPHND